MYQLLRPAQHASSLPLSYLLNNFKFREIIIDEINEESIGALMANSIIETIATCVYFDVDPFDQPAVEQGKILAKKYLS